MNLNKFKYFVRKSFSFLKKYYNLILFLLVGIITIVIIYREVKLEDLISIVNNSNLYYLGLSLFLIFIYWIMEAFMLLILIRFEFPNESFSHAFTLMMIGQFYNQVTPSSTGGQPLQLIEMTSEGIKSGSATAILVQKYALYQLSVTIIGIIGTLTNIPTILSWEPIGRLLLYIGLLINLIGSFLIILVALKPVFADKLLSNLLNFVYKLHLVTDKQKWQNKINEFVNDYTFAVKGLKRRSFATISLLLFNIVAIVLYYSITFYIFKSLGFADSEIWKIIMLQAVCYLMVAFVPLPGAAGGAELGFIIVFGGLIGVAETSFALLAWRFITFYFILAFGGIYIAIFSVLKGKKKL